MNTTHKNSETENKNTKPQLDKRRGSYLKNRIRNASKTPNQDLILIWARSGLMHFCRKPLKKKA
jgi:hypothetical protein